jgi:hypothetical protein
VLFRSPNVAQSATLGLAHHLARTSPFGEAPRVPARETSYFKRFSNISYFFVI